MRGLLDYNVYFLFGFFRIEIVYWRSILLLGNDQVFILLFYLMIVLRISWKVEVKLDKVNSQRLLVNYILYKVFF